MYVSEVTCHVACMAVRWPVMLHSQVREREIHNDAQASPAVLCIQSKTPDHGIGWHHSRWVFPLEIEHPWNTLTNIHEDVFHGWVQTQREGFLSGAGVRSKPWKTLGSPTEMDSPEPPPTPLTPLQGPFLGPSLFSSGHVPPPAFFYFSRWTDSSPWSLFSSVSIVCIFCLTSPSRDPLCSLCLPLCLPLTLATPILCRLWLVHPTHPAERRGTSPPQIQEESKYPAFLCWSQTMVSHEWWGENEDRQLYSSSAMWKRFTVSMWKACLHLHNVWHMGDALQMFVSVADVLLSLSYLGYFGVNPHTYIRQHL